ncbi:MAG: MOSC domain-containing protein [Gammaproteobacteria bacterium]|nr:MAG: MOSC domain-containing protein [Gammaproteobacteria bacterium]
MTYGTVIAIYTAPSRAAATESRGEVRAVPGRGLVGDRYYEGCGTYSDDPGPDRELTLIELERLEALREGDGIELSGAEARRNIVTRGVSLNELVGAEFHVGTVRVRGIRLCEPCAHLQRLTAKTVVKALVHKGGLRAQILTQGVIRVGDRIVI